MDRCAAGPPQTSRCPSQCAVTWTKKGHFKELVWKWKDGLCLYQLYIPHRIHVLGIYTFGRFFLVGTVFFCFEGFTFKDERGHFKIFQGVFENGRIGGDSWPFQNTYVECLGILRFDDFFKGNYSKGPFGRVLCDLQQGSKGHGLDHLGYIGCLYLGLRRSQATGMERRHWKKKTCRAHRKLIMWIPHKVRTGAQFAPKQLPDACTPSREGKGLKMMKRCFRWRALKSGVFSSKPMILIMNDVPLFLWRVWCEELEAKPQQCGGNGNCGPFKTEWPIWHESLTWTLRCVPNGWDLGIPKTGSNTTIPPGGCWNAPLYSIFVRPVHP